MFHEHIGDLSGRRFSSWECFSKLRVEVRYHGDEFISPSGPY